MSISDNDAGDDCSDNSIDKRMAQLEIKLAFLEHTVDLLAGELEAQQSETRTLRKTLEGVHQQLDSLQHDTGNSDQHNEPPPHY